jgi:hypothetical protein
MRKLTINIIFLFFACFSYSQIPNLTIKYPASDNIVLVKTLKQLMICDTAGNLKTPGELIFDGSILFNYGKWNSPGLPQIFRVFECTYTKNEKAFTIDNITNAYPFSNGYAIVQKGNKYNYINRDGKLIGSSWYDYAENFSEGLALAGIGKWDKGCFNGKLGFIDSTQKAVIPFIFESAESFSNGAAKVWLKGKALNITPTGTPVGTQSASTFEAGLNSLRTTVNKDLFRPEDKENSTFFNPIDNSIPRPSDNGWDYIKGNQVILHVNFEYVNKFCEGFAMVKKAGKWNFINSEGKLLSNEWFNYAESFRQGIAIVKSEGKGGIIDSKGKFVIPYIYPVKYFSGGRACIEKNGEKEKEVTFIDKNGAQIIKWMSATTEFKNGRAEIKNDEGLYATIDTTGEIIETWHFKVLFSGDLVDVLECNDKYNLREKKGSLTYNWIPDVSLFSEGFLAIKKNGKWGFIDKYGKLLIRAEFDECWDFKDRRALVRKEKQFNWIDNNGRYISKEWFDGVGQYHEDVAAVMKKGRWGYIDDNGQIIIKLNYQAAADFSEGFALVKKGGKFGFITKKGKNITKFEFTAGGNFKDGSARVKKGKVSGYVNRHGMFTTK